jgi:hypothetical protein
VRGGLFGFDSMMVHRKRSKVEPRGEKRGEGYANVECVVDVKRYRRVSLDSLDSFVADVWGRWMATCGGG